MSVIILLLFFFFFWTENGLKTEKKGKCLSLAGGQWDCWKFRQAVHQPTPFWVSDDALGSHLFLCGRLSGFYDSADHLEQIKPPTNKDHRSFISTAEICKVFFWPYAYTKCLLKHMDPFHRLWMLLAFLTKVYFIYLLPFF